MWLQAVCLELFCARSAQAWQGTPVQKPSADEFGAAVAAVAARERAVPAFMAAAARAATAVRAERGRPAAAVALRLR